MSSINKLAWNTQIVDPETGLPTPFFLMLWQTIADRKFDSLKDIQLPTNPADGATLTLTYNAEKKKWIGS